MLLVIIKYNTNKSYNAWILINNKTVSINVTMKNFTPIFSILFSRRNCDDIQGKIMRSLYRPDMFLSISSKTWTIMSFKYKTVHYKKV